MMTLFAKSFWTMGTRQEVLQWHQHQLCKGLSGGGGGGRNAMMFFFPLLLFLLLVIVILLLVVIIIIIIICFISSSIILAVVITIIIVFRAFVILFPLIITIIPRIDRGFKYGSIEAEEADLGTAECGLGVCRTWGHPRRSMSWLG